MRGPRVLAALTCILLACGGSPAPGQHQGASPLAHVKRMVIPLDDKQPGAEVSLARNFYFIFDGSGSMTDSLSRSCTGGKKSRRKIDGAQWAVAEFMKAVPSNVRLGLYVFDTGGAREVVPLAADNRAQFLKAVGDVHAGGGTPLAAAIRNGTDALVKQYQKQLGYGEFRLVVVTDGLADDIPAAAVYAAQRGIPIYAIGLCIGGDHPLRQYCVSYRAADSFDDLQRGLEDTLAELPDVAPTDFH